MKKTSLTMYKKLGCNSVMTIPMHCGVPMTREAQEFVNKLKENVKGTNKRVVLRGRKPIPGVKFDFGGNIPLEDAQEADVYIYNKTWC